jgi:hypothetical protein
MELPAGQREYKYQTPCMNFPPSRLKSVVVNQAFKTPKARVHRPYALARFDPT